MAKGENDSWTADGRGRIVITGNAGIGRYVFGVPLLLFGAYFLYKYLVLGIADYIKAGDIAGIFTGIFGWLVVILMGGIFFVPGWLLVFLRRRVVIDVPHSMVAEKNDFLLFSRGKSQRLTGFGAIQVVETASTSQDKTGGTTSTVTTWMHEVRLLPRGEGNYVLAGIMQDEAEARKLAAAMAELLRLPWTYNEKFQEEK